MTKIFTFGSNNSIFVFGANTAGRHGAGAARRARTAYGARYGQGKGLQGNAYAIPTKDSSLKTLPVNKISKYVKEFKDFAVLNSDKEFYVTKIGTGLAGISNEVMARMFIDSPSNCIFDESWREYLGDTYKYFSGRL